MGAYCGLPAQIAQISCPWTRAFTKMSAWWSQEVPIVCQLVGWSRAVLIPHQENGKDQVRQAPATSHVVCQEEV